jgi:hypothetical protein
VPGSTVRVLKILLDSTDIEPYYKDTILAAKSWGQNCSYWFGTIFGNAVKAGKTLDQAVKEEKEALKHIWIKPTEAQRRLKPARLHSSYIDEYRKRMKDTIQTAVKAGVHYANIVTVPFYGLTDIGEHISGYAFGMAKDDMVMAILKAVTQVAENTLQGGLRDRKFQNEWQVLRTATGSTAAAVTYILELDSFTSSMIIDLFSKRWPNMILKGDLTTWGHWVDFLDMLARGERIIEKRPVGSGGKTGEVDVDLTPVDESDVIMNPSVCSGPGPATTTRFSALMRLADFPCLITPEPLTIPLLTNITALNKKKPIAPSWHCKSCATTRYWKRHEYCYTERESDGKHV